MADFVYPSDERAPDDAEYILANANDNLSNSWVLDPGTGISITYHAGIVTIDSTGGGYPTGTYITKDDETSALPNSLRLHAGSGVSFDISGNVLTINATAAGGSGSGTVTSVSVGNLAPLFVSNTVNPTTNVVTSFTLSTTASGNFFAGPASGADAGGNYRRIVYSDLPLVGSANIVLTPSGSSYVISATGLQPLDATLTALAAFNSNGILVQTAADTFTSRTITGTANQVAVAAGDGVSGNPTISLPSNLILPSGTTGTTQSANDNSTKIATTSYVDTNKQPLDSTLTSLAAYNTNGLITQTAADTFTGRTIQSGDANYVSVTNGNGVSGDPTVGITSKVYTTATSNLLNALASSSGVGYLVQNGSVTINRTFQGTGNRVSVTNGTGVSGNTQIDVGTDVYTISTNNLLNSIATGTGGNGVVVQSGSNYINRSIATVDATLITVSNADGTTGNPTVGLGSKVFSSNTSSLLNALSSSTAGSTGIVVQKSDTSFIDRTIQGVAGRTLITNGDGLSGNPIVDIGPNVFTTSNSNLINTLSTSTGTGYMVQNGQSLLNRSIVGTGNRIVSTNQDGTAGNTQLDVGSDVYTISTNNILNKVASSVPGQGQFLLGNGSNYNLATFAASTGLVLTISGNIVTFTSTATSGGGSGTVTSVDMSVPSSLLTVSGNPITTSGTLSVTLTNAPSATVWCGPTSGANASPTYKQITPAYIGSNYINCGVFIDGASSLCSTGEVGYLTIDATATIQSVTILGGPATGSCTFNIYKSTYSSFPTMTSIVASAKPTITNDYKNQDSTLTGWTTSVSPGDVLKFVLESNTNFQEISILLKLLRTG